jgi:purine-binding chemotaxis protein CheW
MQTSITKEVNIPMPAADQRAGKYLAFHVGPEQFAISVLSVREIMGMQEITAVPQTPACVKGIINLRGKVVPVIDLRLKFGMPETEHTARTCIIVVNVPGEGGRVMAGVIVDSVSEVANIAGGEIESPPDFGEGVSIPWLIGIAKTRGGVKLLLNIERVLTSSDVSGIGHLIG